MCDSRGFTLMETVLVLCLTSFLILLFSIYTPMPSYLREEMERVREYLVQAHIEAMQKHETIAFSFASDALLIGHQRYPYRRGITSDIFSLRFYEDGTISQAKTICFYHRSQQACFYFQLGSGYIDIR